MIQFISVTLLYIIGSNLADYQFLYIDLGILIPLSMLMGFTEAYKHLTPHLPSASLVSVPVLASVLGNVVIQMVFQLFMFFYIRTWDFYEPHVIDPEQDDSSQACYENSALFLFANF
jgi:cation-transporting ATPase 13A2